MTDFIIKQLPYALSSNAGLAIVGKILHRAKLDALVDSAFPVRSGLSNSAIIKSYLALLCQGKNDFDAIEGFRDDDFFKRSMGLSAVPSSPTMRQRLDLHAASWFALVTQINQVLLSARVNGRRIDFGALECGYTALDIDTFAMDNGNTKKELVGRTYTGVDGYCPLVAYLGNQGYCLEFALRPGQQHSACESEYDLERVLPMASALVGGRRLLIRADSGFCAGNLIQTIASEAARCGSEMACIIKWNPRGTPVENVAAGKVADTDTQWTQLRPGKRECLWQEALQLKGVDNARRIYRLTERSIDKHGQPMLLAQYVLEGWTTTLPAKFRAQEVIALYRDHATHEQFHSEFKTDMDLERLPSGKFDTNYLVCQLAAVAMNLLRLIGQHTLHEPDSPMRHAAKRRRIRTVLQEMMGKAARMIKHAGRWVLGLGANDKGCAVFARYYGQLDSS